MKKETAQQILEKNKEAYDKIAEKFSHTRRFLWPEFKDFLPYINKGDKILDAGCGNGRLIELLINKNINYTGIDYSKNLIALAKKRYPEYNFILGSITTLPFSDNEFNIIFCLATFHHIPGATLRQQTIREFSRVLKKNGYLIMTNWNLWQKQWWPTRIQNALRKILGSRRLDWQDTIKPWKNEQGKIVTQRYIHALRPREIKKLLNKNGLILLKQYYTKKGKSANCITGYNLVTIAQKNK